MKKEVVDESIARNKKRYRDFGKRIADTLWVFDARTLKVLFVSDMAQNLCGYRGQEIVGGYLREITTDDSYQMALIELTKAMRAYEQGEATALRLEIECYNVLSTTVWIEMVARFVREEGEPVQLVGISRDISDRKFSEMNREHLLKMYMETLAEEQRLRSDIELCEKLLPICSGCRQIRDDHHRWWPLEAYVLEKTDNRPSNIFCPECARRHYSGK